MKIKLGLLAATILAGVGGGEAAAQTATKPGVAKSDEIVVTAQRRATTAQNVGASIAVLSAKSVEQTGTTGTTTLQFATPGLVVSQDVSLQTQIYIRGIGSNLQ